MTHLSSDSPVFGRILKTKKESLGTYLVRWYEFISSLAASQLAVQDLQKQNTATKVKKIKERRQKYGRG